MIAFTDVHYEGGSAVAACILAGWDDELPSREVAVRIDDVEPYAPGEFYRRELPCLLAVLAEVGLDEIELVVVDGYVWLDADGRPGLGAHLWEELGQQVPVVGVAKNAFRGADFAVPVLRGESKRPLYVTAAGWEGRRAADELGSMHGPYRVPTLLRCVDRLCREAEPSVGSESEE